MLEQVIGIGGMGNKVIGKAHTEKLLNFDPQTDEVVLSPLGVRYVEEEIDLEVR